MAQIASSYAEAPAAQPTSAYAPTETDTPSAAAFGQALRDAGYDAPTNAETAGDDSTDAADSRNNGKDDGLAPGRKRKGEAASGLLGLFAGRPPERLSLHGRSDREGGLGDLVGGGAGRLAPGPTATVDGPASADLDSFADLLDRAAALAPVQLKQVFQLSLGGASLPVSAVETVRQPDGSLAVTLQADNQAVTQVRASLETLRRRLQARGVALANLSVEGEFAPDVPQQDTA
jgi:hypothetical protein